MMIRNGDDVTLPEGSQPSPSQAQGEPLELLAEIAGRTCYDSFGRGRSSKEFHEHILEVGHLSVYEHCTFTVQFDGVTGPQLLAAFVNLPNTWVTGRRVTLNLRHVLEWEDWHDWDDDSSSDIGETLRHLANGLAPMIVEPHDDRFWPARVVEPSSPEEEWYSFLLTGSRGFSHELVRHGDFTAISQRSTRYVDESNSRWCHHPKTEHLDPDLMDEVYRFEDDARALYSRVARQIEDRLFTLGVGRLAARKQARGAARGYLGNALETQVLFSASRAQWERIFKQRCSVHADDEIRLIMEAVRDELESS